MQVFLKQSGELLAKGDDSQLWTPDGVRSSIEKVATAYKNRQKLGLSGITLVSGAGNIIRGNALRERGIANGHADVIGRLATIQNTIVLMSALQERRIPTKTFVAASMSLQDNSLTGEFEPYSVEAALEALQEEFVVLIGGGTGEDGVTTDNAVMEYASDMRTLQPDDEVLILKGTKHDGVFDEDPAKNPRARRYETISAQYMLRHYKKFKVVDEASLRQIADTGLSMRIYRDGQHDLAAVVAGLTSAGTLIISDESHEPVLAA